MPKIAIFHPTDPLGYVPGGIDTVIRGILKWAPPDLDYTLFGATSDEGARPVGREIDLPFGNGNARFVPLASIDSRGRRSVVPVTLRYLLALRRYIRHGRCKEFDVLDFHRVDPLWLFRHDGRPKNITVHQDMSIIRDEACDIMWRHAPWLYERIERTVFYASAHIFTVRQSAVKRYTQLYPDLADRITFLPTWVESTIFSPPSDEEGRRELRSKLLNDLGLERPSIQVLTSVGRLDKQKDPMLLLQAFSEALNRIPDLHMVLIGDGVLRPEVERVCQTLHLSGRVSLLGVMSPAQIANVLRGSDLFVLSSAYEGMPIAVLEALATGLPVVSTNVGEIPLVVHSGSTGQISQERTPQSLAAAICTALGQIASMSGKPCELAVSQYNPETVLTMLYGNHRAQVA
jgi:glycosyltransferase involved in cell wall biosynthesis